MLAQSMCPAVNYALLRMPSVKKDVTHALKQQYTRCCLHMLCSSSNKHLVAVGNKDHQKQSMSSRITLPLQSSGYVSDIAVPAMRTSSLVHELYASC
jgi:hypothetical protein